MNTFEIPFEAINALKRKVMEAEDDKDFESCAKYCEALRILYATIYRASKQARRTQRKVKDE